MVAISFTLARRSFEFSADDVRALIAKRRPDPIYQYWIEIDGMRWPVKQVMALATGLSKREFLLQNSRRLLVKLGFTISKGLAVFVPTTTTAAPRQTAPTHPPVDAHLLDGLETEILFELDPPLSLATVSETPLRAQHSVRRNQYAGGR